MELIRQRLNSLEDSISSLSQSTEYVELLTEAKNLVDMLNKKLSPLEEESWKLCMNLFEVIYFM
jgi:hypothetical protein